MAAAGVYKFASLLVVFLITGGVCTTHPDECTKGWYSLSDKEYCFGNTNLTFDDSHSYCQSQDADLPVLNTYEDYMNLLAVLQDYSEYKFLGSNVDVFLGLYQRKCVVGVESDCNWLTPFSGQWFWIQNDDQHITDQSDTFWQILEFNHPLITDFTQINSVEVQNNQHFILGSDNHTSLVDGFVAEEEFLYKLYPLCVRVPVSVSEERQVSSTGVSQSIDGPILITMMALFSVSSLICETHK